jgi:site-specific recombinase XerD
MTHEIIPNEQNEITLHQETPLTDLAAEYMQASKSKNTLANYRHTMELFQNYMLDKYGLDMGVQNDCLKVDQGIMSNYLSYLTSEERRSIKNKKQLKPLKASSVLRHLSALRDFFGYVAETTSIPFKNPTVGKKVGDTIEGIQRQLGTAPKKKRAITLEVVEIILNEIKGESLADKRDAAMISLGFAGAFRRSELAGIDVDHLTFKDSGIVLFLPKSKTDQKGEGAWKHIAYGKQKNNCPVRLVQQWLKASGIKEGAVFCSIGKGGNLGSRINPASIARIIKDRAELAGLLLSCSTQGISVLRR